MEEDKKLEPFFGKDLKKLREEVVRKWQESGLLDGLKNAGNRFDWMIQDAKQVISSGVIIEKQKNNL